MALNIGIYNNLSTTLQPKRRNTTHNSSDLRKVYTSMAKYNKSNPLYILSMSSANQSQVISIKEAAITMLDVTNSLSDPSAGVYSKKMISVDNEEVLSAAFRSNRQAELPEKLSLTIKSLATEQVNTGHYLPSSELNFEPGSYSMNIASTKTTAGFSLTVAPEDTNLTVQNKLAQFINNRNIGINASVIEEGGSSALMLSSTGTGAPNTADGLYFNVSDGRNDGFVKILGLDQIETYPSDSEFTINGDEHTSSSNHISINQTVELDFKKPSASPVNVNFIADTDQIIDQLDAFIDAYNQLVDLAKASGETRIGNRNLYQDISRITNRHLDEFDAAGIKVTDDEKLAKTEGFAKSEKSSEKLAILFSDNDSLKSDILSIAKKLSLDPVAYINKTLVSYPNNEDKTGTVYTQSIYSGLMYNNYA